MCNVSTVQPTAAFPDWAVLSVSATPASTTKFPHAPKNLPSSSSSSAPHLACMFTNQTLSAPQSLLLLFGENGKSCS